MSSTTAVAGTDDVVRGVGIDIIEIDRIRKSIESGGDRFLQRVFTTGEIAYCSAKQYQHQHYAARFAAKEAVSKALSTGWAGVFSWRDIEVSNDGAGAPRIVLHGTLQEQLSASRIHLSLSHSASHVVAMAVIEDK